MTGYREILRLSAQGISQRSIARSCGCSRNTVARVLSQAQQQKVEWNAVMDLEEGQICNRLFPGQVPANSRKVPDYEYVHQEMARSGVTLSLLWNEYCEECRTNNEIAFGYTQFGLYYNSLF